MISIHGAYIPGDATVTVGVDFSVPISNILTFITEGAEFAADEPAVNRSVMQKVFQMTALPEYLWFGSALTGGDEGRTASEKAGKAIDVLLAASLSDSRALRDMNEDVRSLVSILMSPVAVRDDYGACLQEELVRERLYTAIHRGFGVLPATGYPRPILRSEIRFPDPKDCFTLPHYASPAVDRVAFMLMRLDQYRIDIRHFNIEGKYEGITTQEKMFGPMVKIKHLLRKLYVYFNLYRVAALRLLWGVHKRLRRVARAAYTRRLGERHPDVVLMDQSFEAQFERLPQHPLGSYMESFFDTGDVMTEKGLHPGVWLNMQSPDFMAPLLGGTTTACGPNVDRFAALYESHLVSVASDPTSLLACRSRVWGVDAPTESVLNSRMIISELIAAIEGDTLLTEEMRAMASSLGWSAITGQCGTIDMLGSDFILTDGIYLSGSPDQALMGMSPTLSLGNIRHRSLSSLAVGENFRPSEQRIFVVPVKGFTDIVASGDHVERRYLIDSMTMGETDAGDPLSVLNGAPTDPVVQSIILHYARKESRYLNWPYLPLEIPDNERVRQTIWDPVGETVAGDGDSSQLAVDWANAIGNVGAPASKQLYSFRSSGQPFYGRVIVRLARDTRYHIFSNRGIHIGEFLERGNVYFNNEIHLPHDASSLDKLFSMTPAAQAPQKVEVRIEAMTAAAASANKVGG